jgi:hypothetical protein
MAGKAGSKVSEPELQPGVPVSFCRDKCNACNGLKGSEWCGSEYFKELCPFKDEAMQSVKAFDTLNGGKNELSTGKTG